MELTDDEDWLEGVLEEILDKLVTEELVRSMVLLKVDGVEELLALDGRSCVDCELGDRLDSDDSDKEDETDDGSKAVEEELLEFRLLDEDVKISVEDVSSIIVLLVLLLSLELEVRICVLAVDVEEDELEELDSELVLKSTTSTTSTSSISAVPA